MLEKSQRPLGLESSELGESGRRGARCEDVALMELVGSPGEVGVSRAEGGTVQTQVQHGHGGASRKEKLPSQMDNYVLRWTHCPQCSNGKLRLGECCD